MLDEIVFDLNLERQDGLPPRGIKSILADMRRDMGVAVDNSTALSLRREAFSKVLNNDRPKGCHRVAKALPSPYTRLSEYEVAEMRAMVFGPRNPARKFSLIGIGSSARTPVFDGYTRLANVIETIEAKTYSDGYKPAQWSATNYQVEAYKAHIGGLTDEALSELPEDEQDEIIEKTLGDLLDLLSKIRWPSIPLGGSGVFGGLFRSRWGMKDLKIKSNEQYIGMYSKLADALREWQNAGCPRSVADPAVETWWADQYAQKDAGAPESLVEVRLRADAPVATMTAVLAALGGLKVETNHDDSGNVVITANSGE